MVSGIPHSTNLKLTTLRSLNSRQNAVSSNAKHNARQISVLPLHSHTLVPLVLCCILVTNHSVRLRRPKSHDVFKSSFNKPSPFSPTSTDRLSISLHTQERKRSKLTSKRSIRKTASIPHLYVMRDKDARSVCYMSVFSVCVGILWLFLKQTYKH